MREFLEKHYSAETAKSEREVIKLALKALLEVVQSGSKNMEIALMRKGEPLKVCTAGWLVGPTEQFVCVCACVS